MKAKIFSILSVVAFMVALGSVAKADDCTTSILSCDLTVTNGQISPTNPPYATVNLSFDSGSHALTVTVTADGNYGFDGSAGSNGMFGFNLDKTVTASEFTWAPSCTAATCTAAAGHEDGFGAFTWSIFASAPNPNNPWSSFSFTITDPNLTGVSDILGLNGSGVQFAARVTPIPTNGCTGFVGTDAPSGGFSSSSSTPLSTCTSSTVPEPGSLALFGTGVLGLAGMLKRKLLA